MKPVEAIFAEICQAGNAGDALRALGAGSLSRLIRHLRERGPDGSVAGMVLAMAEFEAVERFLKIQDNKA